MLQQSNNLRMLAQIASCTTNNKILRTVRTAFTQRYNVINVIGITNFDLAIVALARLVFVLFTNISRSMSATIARFQGATAVLMNSIVVWMIFRITLKSRLTLLRVIFTVFSILLSVIFDIFSTCLPLLFDVRGMISAIRLSMLFNARLLISVILLSILTSILRSLLRSTKLTNTIETALSRFLNMKILGSCWEKLLACITLMHAFNHLFDRAKDYLFLFMTLNAMLINCIFSTRIEVKEVGSCRLELSTGITLLLRTIMRYSIVHKGTTILLSARSVDALPSKTIYTSFYHKTACSAMLRAFFVS